MNIIGLLTLTALSVIIGIYLTIPGLFYDTVLTIEIYLHVSHAFFNHKLTKTISFK